FTISFPVNLYNFSSPGGPCIYTLLPVLLIILLWYRSLRSCILHNRGAGLPFSGHPAACQELCEECPAGRVRQDGNLPVMPGTFLPAPYGLPSGYNQPAYDKLL